VVRPAAVNAAVAAENGSPTTFGTVTVRCRTGPMTTDGWSVFVPAAFFESTAGSTPNATSSTLMLLSTSASTGV
jgi:hypothetical protein